MSMRCKNKYASPDFKKCALRSTLVSNFSNLKKYKDDLTLGGVFLFVCLVFGVGGGRCIRW